MLEISPTTGLPPVSTIAKLIGEDLGACAAPHMAGALLDPAGDLLARPSKRFRAQLVELGHALCNVNVTPEQRRRLILCEQAVELLHAGSLIVDDIQDGSLARRGQAAIHRRYGVPSAICTGNWLYFWPLRLLRDMELPVAAEHRVFGLYHDALEKAHYGQALDLKLRADETPAADILAVAHTISELKTGSITSLAMVLGAVLADADDKTSRALTVFGCRFGVALQSLDDLGNILNSIDRTKQYEDLLQRKVTAVWGYAGSLASPDELRGFVSAVRALDHKDSGPLTDWLETTGFVRRAGAVVNEDLNKAFADLQAALDLSPLHPALRELRRLAERLLHAYE